VAAAFGLASALSVVVLGDESGYLANLDQQMKIAAMEGMWDTEKAPASFNLIGFPDQENKVTKGAIKIPYVLGIIATRSFNEPVLGINELVGQAKIKIRYGIEGYGALQRLMKDRNDTNARVLLSLRSEDIGYALLLKKFTDDVVNATPEQIELAAWSTVPNVPVLFWSFRLMVGCGFFFILLFTTAAIVSVRHKFESRFFLWMAFLSLPLPWLAAELGWVVAEVGRQPWVIQGILPTFLGTSSLTTTALYISIAGFVLLYSLLAIVEIFLMVKYIKLGPEYVREN